MGVKSAALALCMSGLLLLCHGKFDGRAVKVHPLPCSFGSYDDNSDKVITSEEFLSFAVNRGYKEERLPGVFAVLDVNGDGVVYLDEFKAGAPILQRQKLFGKCKKCWLWCHSRRRKEVHYHFGKKR